MARASAARLSPRLLGATIAALLARLGLGGVSLALMRTGPDAVMVVMVVMSVLFGAALLAFVYVSIRAVRGSRFETRCPERAIDQGQNEPAFVSDRQWLEFDADVAEVATRLHTSA